MIDSLGPYRNGVLYQDSSIPGVMLPRVFDEFTVVAFSGDSLMFVGNATSGEVEVYSVASQPRKIDEFVLPLGRGKVTTAQLEFERGRLAERWAVSRTILEKLSRGTRIPAFANLIGGREGDELWVKEFPTEPRSTDIWFAFRADGTPLCRREMPSARDILEMGMRSAIAVHVDSLGIEQVVVYSSRDDGM